MCFGRAAALDQFISWRGASWAPQEDIDSRRPLAEGSQFFAMAEAVFRHVLHEDLLLFNCVLEHFWLTTGMDMSQTRSILDAICQEPSHFGRQIVSEAVTLPDPRPRRSVFPAIS